MPLTETIYTNYFQLLPEPIILTTSSRIFKAVNQVPYRRQTYMRDLQLSYWLCEWILSHTCKQLLHLSI